MHDIYNVVSTPSALVNFTPLTTKHFQFCDAIMNILFRIVSKLNTYVFGYDKIFIIVLLPQFKTTFTIEMFYCTNKEL
jgi:hypothetical protein